MNMRYVRGDGSSENFNLFLQKTEDARTIDAKFVSTSIISGLLKFPPKTQHDPELELQTWLLEAIACCKQLSC